MSQKTNTVKKYVMSIVYFLLRKMKYYNFQIDYKNCRKTPSIFTNMMNHLEVNTW